MDLFEEIGHALRPDNIKASIVVMSHLSDAGFLNVQVKPLDSNIHINFAKYIILQCGGDLTKDIDVNKMWNEYSNLHMNTDRLANL
jgi:hypothetical protein